MLSLAQVIKTFNPGGVFNPSENWMQGRTLYGGLSTALALQAARLRSSVELPPLKSAQVAFIGPIVDELRFQVQPLRYGKSAALLDVSGASGADTSIRALFMFGSPRASRIRHDFVSRPTVKGPEAYPALTAQDKRIAPACAHNFEMRPAGGSLPVSGAKNPELLFWMRHLDARNVDSAVALVALADGMPPAAFTSLVEPAPISSATWTFDLLQPSVQGEWFLLRSFSRHALDGYSVQDMEIWDQAGRPVLWGRQTVTVFA